MGTNELNFHAWWTVNEKASFKPLSGTLWIVIIAGEGERKRERLFSSAHVKDSQVLAVTVKRVCGEDTITL